MSEQVKRKAADDNDDDDDFGDAAAAATTATTSATTKKAKTTTRPPKSDILGKDGEFFELGPLRFARVSEFKGKKSVDIREYYQDANDGDILKPGKKGIALKPEEFQALVDSAPDLFALLKKK